MSEWQLIETAPRNKRVDLFGSLGPKRGVRVPDCYWHAKAGAWRCKHYDRDGYSALRLPFEPTHWRLVPSPPEPSP